MITITDDNNDNRWIKNDISNLPWCRDIAIYIYKFEYQYVTILSYRTIVFYSIAFHKLETYSHNMRVIQYDARSRISWWYSIEYQMSSLLEANIIHEILAKDYSAQVSFAGKICFLKNVHACHSLMRLIRTWSENWTDKLYVIVQLVTMKNS